MTQNQDTETLKENIERRLAERAASDPEFFKLLMLDPNSVIKPMISEAFGDDGAINLADVSTSVHVETGKNLHFVLPVVALDAEVVGFAFDLSLSLNSMTTAISPSGPVEARSRTLTKRCWTDNPESTSASSGCPTVYTKP